MESGPAARLSTIGAANGRQDLLARRRQRCGLVGQAAQDAASAGRLPRRKARGHRRRMPTAARTTPRADASAAAPSSPAPLRERRGAPRRQPFARGAAPLAGRVDGLLAACRKLSPCSAPGNERRRAARWARWRRSSGSRRDRRCGSRQSARCSASWPVPPRQPWEPMPPAPRRPAWRRLRPERYPGASAFSALSCGSALPVSPWAQPGLRRRGPRFGSPARGSTCSSAGIAATPCRPADAGAMRFIVRAALRPDGAALGIGRLLAKMPVSRSRMSGRDQRPNAAARLDVSII